MTELFINSKRVIFDKDQSFKIVRENVFFNRTSSYTYDIKIPLNIIDNIRVFGHLSRHDVQKENLKYDAEVRLNNKTLIKGSAKILDVDDNKISIQILSGNAEINAFFSNIYIDELDLGQDYTPPKWMDYIVNTALGKETNIEFFRPYPDAKYVYFPVYNKATDITYNNIFPIIDYNLKPNIHFGQTLGNYPSDLTFPLNWVSHPYLCYAIKYIFLDLGYRLNSNFIESTFLKDLFIVNKSGQKPIAKALPHWTVAKFIEEVENLTASRFVFDDERKSFSVISLEDFYQQVPVEIISVIDGEEAEYDEENKDILKNINATNIGYNLGNSDFFSKYRKINQDILDLAIYREYYDLNMLYNQWENVPDDEKYKTIFCAKGHQMIVIDDKLEFVNQFRNLIRDEESDDILELNIVPAEIEIRQVKGFSRKGSDYFYVSMATLVCDQNVMSEDNFNIVDAIEGNWDKPEQKSEDEVMQVALNSAITQCLVDSFDTIKGYCPIPNIDLIVSASEKEYKYKDNLYLHHSGNGYNLDSLLNANSLSINTQVLQTFYFTDEKIPNPNNIVLINNKKYCIKDIEYDLDHKGVSKVKKLRAYQVI